jgi:hypothetical protein
MSQNLVSATLTAEDRAAVLAALDTIAAKLPFLRGLTAEERRSLPRMGDKSVAFVNQCLRAAQQNADLLPARSPVPALEQDLALLAELQTIAERVDQLDELLTDTTTALRSDAFVAALGIYGILKATGNAAGLDELRNQLSARFSRGGGTAEPAAPTAPPK